MSHGLSTNKSIPDKYFYPKFLFDNLKPIILRRIRVPEG